MVRYCDGGPAATARLPVVRETGTACGIPSMTARWARQRGFNFRRLQLMSRNMPACRAQDIANTQQRGLEQPRRIMTWNAISAWDLYKSEGPAVQMRPQTPGKSFHKLFAACLQELGGWLFADFTHILEKSSAKAARHLCTSDRTEAMKNIDGSSCFWKNGRVDKENDMNWNVISGVLEQQ